MGTLSEALAWSRQTPRGSLHDPRDACARSKVKPVPPPRGLGADLDAEVTRQMSALGDKPNLQQAYALTLYQLSDKPGLLKSFIHRVKLALDLDQRV